MLAPYQPQPVLLQTAPWPAVPAVPVVVEVKRMNDNAFFMYNVNVHTPEMACAPMQVAQTGTTVPLQTAPLAQAEPEVFEPATLIALPHTQQAQILPQKTNDGQTGIVDKNQYFYNQNVSVDSGEFASNRTRTPTLSDRFDENWPSNVYELPQELTNLFSWNTCGLCHTFMRSMRNAVDHYSSRAHDRKVNVWLMRNLNRTDPILKSPGAFYCELCDLKLTSITHANQHFLGRRHRLVASHASKPNGSGYYDAFGKWVRTNGKLLVCPLCDVSITSESQMAMHLAGSKHKRRSNLFNSEGLGINGSYVYLFSADGTLHPLNPNGNYFLPCQQNGNAVKFTDMDAMYFCEACEVSLNHLKSVKQHENGKMHRKNVGMMRYRRNYTVFM